MVAVPITTTGDDPFLHSLDGVAGPAQTALVGGAMVLVGHLLLEAACVCAAPAPPTPTTMLQSRNPFSRTLSTPIIPIILSHPHCSSPDILEQEGIDELFPWNSQNCSVQVDELQDCHPFRFQIMEERVGLGHRALLREAQELVVV
ncbi:hypothetical protein ATANTOWER_030103 [Ataeniobius toweri]|uniref:Uncharacterized protein n=1 Tax=Ataeniobius toweri TaxID=208326 RepID=A0ABU7A993_9TELE|nr:hypothetical protein [Ataeniobius toweri]